MNRNCNRVRRNLRCMISPTAPDLPFLSAVEDNPVIPQRPSFKRPDSSVGRATDWKSVCRWFNSTSGHHILINNYSYLSSLFTIFPLPENIAKHCQYASKRGIGLVFIAKLLPQIFFKLSRKFSSDCLATRNNLSLNPAESWVFIYGEFSES